MTNGLEKRTGDLLKILAVGTRRKILEMILSEPKNPQIIADELDISRPAVEKHLKLMCSNYICERSVEPFPSPHYVYFVSEPGLELMNAISTAALVYFQSMDGMVSAEIDQIERDFILQRISRNEYESRLKSLKQKQKDLANLELARFWVEEAKRMITEYEEDRS